MIVKLIRMNRRRRRASNSLARRRQLQRLRQAVFALTRYIVDADPYSLIEAESDILSISDYALAAEESGVEPGEKVEAFGCRNLVSNDLVTWQAQMLAVAARAPKVKSPVLHIILSLREEEEWNADEREEAIDIVLQTLGLERCPVIWAEHGNTPNPHLHLSVVRVDPRTGEAAGSDWLIDDLHQAAAIIAERQGRTQEPGALYIAREGAVFDADTNAMVRDRDGRYIAGWYKAAGKKRNRVPSALLQHRAELVAAAMHAQSWSDFHEAFAKLRVTYDRSGSGARIGSEDASAKASDVHSSLARGKLEQRLGVFEPDIHRLDVDYEAFRNALDGQLAELRASRNEECARLDAWANATIASVRRTQRAALRAGIRQEVLAAKKSLQEAFAAAIKQCIAQRLTLDKWNAANRPVYRRVTTPALVIPAEADGVEQGRATSRQFQTRSHGWSTTYLDERGDRLFTDHRVVIVVHKIDQMAAIDEALLLGAARWGAVSVRGSDAFLQLAAARAAALNISLVGPNGAELPVTSKSAPRPETAPQAKTSMKETERPVDADEKIDRAIRLFSDHPALALRRRQAPGDTRETGKTGPLEVMLKSPKAGEPEAIFSANERLQAFLEERRAQTLERIRAIALADGIERSPPTPAELLDVLKGDEPLRQAAAVMLHDHDFREMLRAVRQRMLQRVPKLNRENAGVPADGSPSTAATNENAEDEAGYSTEDIQTFWQDITGRGGR